MNTADLHLKRFDLSLTVAELRLLAEELQAMEHAPHETPVSADKQIERDRAGEQLLTHLAMLVSDTKESAAATRLSDSLPLLRTSAKYLLTASDRCRRRALLAGKAALLASDPIGTGAALLEVRTFDKLMRELAAQHGISSPLRELVQPVAVSPADLAQLGLQPDELLGTGELLAPA